MGGILFSALSNPRVKTRGNSWSRFAVDPCNAIHDKTLSQKEIFNISNCRKNLGTWGLFQSLKAWTQCTSVPVLEAVARPVRLRTRKKRKIKKYIIFVYFRLSCIFKLYISFIMFIRKQFFQDLGNESAFLWGARQTGKSTLVKYLYPHALYFDLLLGKEFERFQRNPSLLSEIVRTSDPSQMIVIDEIQRIPKLLNEVHWLISNHHRQFILSGSSPRKIIRRGGNLLGGRAMRYELYPLCYPEIPDFNLLHALNNGLLPKLYQIKDAKNLLASYVGNYLKDEVMAEARIRNVASFGKFLEMAAFSNGEMVNYSNIATDCGVSAPTVKEYFQILEDTLIGRFLSSYQKKPKRRVILSPKFYYFDIGIANYLLKRGKIEQGNEAYGKAFEHFIFNELKSHSHYTQIQYPIHYWRTTSQLEVDFILGDHEIAIEVKSTSLANPRHSKGLKSFAEEYNVKKMMLVTNDPYPRLMENVHVIPWRMFLDQLWAGQIIA